MKTHSCKHCKTSKPHIKKGLQQQASKPIIGPTRGVGGYVFPLATQPLRHWTPQLSAMFQYLPVSDINAIECINAIAKVLDICSKIFKDSCLNHPYHLLSQLTTAIDSMIHFTKQADSFPMIYSIGDHTWFSKMTLTISLANLYWWFSGRWISNP